MLGIIDDEWNEVLLINIDLKDLASFAHANKACLIQRLGGDKDEGIS